MEDIYNNSVYLQHNPDWHQADAPVKADFIYRLLSQYNIPYRTLCEIGCGSGEILRILQQKKSDSGVVYHGYDISEEALALSKEKANARLSFFCEDFTRKTLEVPYDVLLVIDVIEHLRDYFTFLEKIKPKGTYTVFHVPLDMFVWSLFREQMLIESKNRVGHIHNFSEDFLLSILKDMGFEIIAKRYTEPDYNSTTIKQRIINILKKSLFKISPRF